MSDIVETGAVERGFRIGATSFIIPADLETNVGFLAGKVDDIEVLLFESDEISTFPCEEVVGRLAAIAERKALTYTIHLPMGLGLGSVDEALRRRSVAMCVRAIKAVAGLCPFAWVLHMEDGTAAFGEGPSDPGSMEALSESVRALKDVGVQAGSLAVENLAYPFEILEEVIEEQGLGVCIDIGHLMLNGRDVVGHLQKWMPLCKVVHLHGVAQGRDHRAITDLDTGLIDVVIESVRSDGRARVVTLEVFSEADFGLSMEVLRKHV